MTTPIPRFDRRLLVVDSALSIASAVVSSALGASWLGSLILAALVPALLTYVHHPGPGRRRRTAIGLALYALLHVLQALLARVRGRQPRPRVPGAGHALRFAEMTAGVAFAITVVTLTVPELVLGDSLVTNRPLTLFPGHEPDTCPPPRPPDPPEPTEPRKKRHNQQGGGAATPTPTSTPRAGRPHPPSIDPTGRPPDRTAPALHLPEDITVRADDDRGAVVRYSVRAVDAVDGPVSAACRPPSGSRFEVGTTTVRCSARDRAANVAGGDFEVRVTAPPDPTRSPTPTPGTPTPDPPVDDAPPRFTGPREIVVDTGRRPPTAVPFPLPPAEDDHDSQPVVTCAPDRVTAGATEKVLCTARDSAGNAADETFYVTARVADG
jgi:hypothetical protein